MPCGIHDGGDRVIRLGRRQGTGANGGREDPAAAEPAEVLDVALPVARDADLDPSDAPHALQVKQDQVAMVVAARGEHGMIRRDRQADMVAQKRPLLALPPQRQRIKANELAAGVAAPGDEVVVQAVQHGPGGARARASRAAAGPASPPLTRSRTGRSGHLPPASPRSGPGDRMLAVARDSRRPSRSSVVPRLQLPNHGGAVMSESDYADYLERRQMAHPSQAATRTGAHPWLVLPGWPAGQHRKG